MIVAISVQNCNNSLHVTTTIINYGVIAPGDQEI